MQRIVVIDCPGSGKSTLSQEIHNRTGIPLFHLDMMYWNADKTTVEKRIFLERLYSVLEKDEWIIDGNYSSTMELRISACDTVIFLDYSPDLVLKASRSAAESRGAICRGSKPKRMPSSSSLLKAITNAKDLRCLIFSKNTTTNTSSF